MLIITSAAYIPQDLIADIGQIPPAFLPLRNRPLYWWQHAALRGCPERVLMSLPSDFQIDDWDMRCIQELGITIVHCDARTNLGESLLDVLARYPLARGEALKLLHGDTLLDQIPWGRSNVVSVAANDGYYQRALVESANGTLTSVRYQYCNPGDQVLSGYFSFAEGGAFQACLRETRDFIPALNGLAATDHSLAIVENESWSDCGHVNAYYRSRAKNTGERVFNKLESNHYNIRKRSSNERKIAAEIAWFEAMPPAMKHYLPQVGRSSKASGSTYYDIEYLHCLPLSDALVYGRVSPKDWEIILHRCREFCVECQKWTPDLRGKHVPGPMYLQKTLPRLEEFGEARNWNIAAPVKINEVCFASLIDLATRAQEIIESAPSLPACLVHGDLCFSNILYDMRAQRIKVIDPRGMDSAGVPSLFGDATYDIAKLFHSIVGGYDFVVAGRVTGQRNGLGTQITVEGDLPSRLDGLARSFRSIFSDLFDRHGGEKVVAAATVHLFLSMLPLHSDDSARQYALMSRAYSLATEYGMVSSP